MGPVRVVLLFIRGILRDRTDLQRKILHFVSSLRSWSNARNGRGSGSATASSGWSYPGSGRTGVPPFSSYSLTP